MIDAWPDEPERDPDTGVYDADKAPFEIVENDSFHLAIFVSRVHETYRCRKCGGDQFIVGTAPYYTAIKCPACGWERCIHDG